MANLKISYNYSYTFEQEYGGISRYFKELIFAIYSNNLAHPKIYSGININQPIRDLPWKINEGKYISSYPCRGLKCIGYVNKIYNRLRNEFFDPDIIHQTNYVKNAFRTRKAKNVLTVYDLIHEIYSETREDFKNSAKIKQESLDQADHILAISHSTKNDLMKYYGIDNNKITVTHLGVSAISGNDKKPHKSPKFDYLLYVGKRGSYKNFYRFIKAYSSSSTLTKDFKIIAFGGGKPSPEENQFINENCPGKVIFVNGNDYQLAIYYRNASAFVYPSEYEGFGLPPLEAMQYGVPVFSSNTSSLPEVVGDAGIYFDPFSFESIQEALEQNIYDSQKLYMIVSAGKKNITKFTWKKCAMETVKAYKYVL